MKIYIGGLYLTESSFFFVDLFMPDDRRPGILDRTLSNLLRAWIDLSDSTRHYITGQPRPDLPNDDLQKVRQQMESFIEAVGDEASVRARAAEFGRVYMGLNREGRVKFLTELATGFDVDRGAVDEAITEVRSAGGVVASRRIAEARLRQALEPRWRALLGRFTTLPEGVKFLVELRAEMLPMTLNNPPIKALSDDLKAMLRAWFDIGLLDLRQIDWSSPAALLEKLIAYESVHAIRSWDDLKNRLESDRRCFGFFHPNMPDEPLIFVEVALVNGIAPSVDQLLDEMEPEIDPKTADTAIFYSISNAQRGLDGISFGNFLIKRVVEVLKHDFPNLKTFSTLSPIPGFSHWFEEVMRADDVIFLKGSERKILKAYSKGESDGDLLGHLLGRVNFCENDVVADLVKVPLTRLAARYLVDEKGRDDRARDAVAHFHLSNGARVERLNWMGDCSERGLKQSFGLTVNYLYRLSDIESNSAAYMGERAIAQSTSVRGFARA